MTRDDVLKEFDPIDQLSWHWDALDIAEAMADEIVRLRGILAALRKPVAWAVFSEKGHLQYVTLSENEAKADESLGRTRTPIYAYPSAAEQEVSNAV